MSASAADPTEPDVRRSALLVIDAQVDFAEGGASPIAGTRAAIPAISALLDAYRRQSLPIVHVVRLYRGEDVDLVRRSALQTGRPLVRPGSPGSQILPELLLPAAPDLDTELLLAGETQRLGPNETAMWKPRWSAFYRTPLHDRLAEHDVSTIVVAGCNFPNCPRATIYDASARDLRVLIAIDATSGITDERLADTLLIGAHAATAAEISHVVSTGSPATTPTRRSGPGHDGSVLAKTMANRSTACSVPRSKPKR